MNGVAPCPQFSGLHIKCRNAVYPRTDPPIQRLPVPDSQVSWDVSWSDYRPSEYQDSRSKGAIWADPDIGSLGFEPKWNALDGKINRSSHMTGGYKLVAGRPQNPIGRTGLTGRGCLGKWGPNHAADPVVTRWKRTADNNVLKHASSGLPVLQFVSIERKDCGQWAIPGGMVDPGEQVSVTLRREFGEEAMSMMEVGPEEKKKIEKSIEALFHSGKLIYKGYVDDPRNTDNSWMETVAVNFHDDNGEAVGKVNLKAGDDAAKVQWMDIGSDIQLYASHKQFLEAVAKMHSAHW